MRERSDLISSPQGKAPQGRRSEATEKRKVAEGQGKLSFFVFLLNCFLPPGRAGPSIALRAFCPSLSLSPCILPTSSPLHFHLQSELVPAIPVFLDGACFLPFQPRGSHTSICTRLSFFDFRFMFIYIRFRVRNATKSCWAEGQRPIRPKAKDPVRLYNL